MSDFREGDGGQSAFCGSTGLNGARGLRHRKVVESGWGISARFLPNRIGTKQGLRPLPTLGELSFLAQFVVMNGKPASAWNSNDKTSQHSNVQDRHHL